MKRTYIFGGAALAAAVAIAMGTGAMTGCGKKKSSAPPPAALAEGSNIVISGSLSLTGTGTSLNLIGEPNLIDVATLKVYCVSFSSPPVAGTGTVAADGSFTLTLAAAQVAVGCFILDSTDAQLGSIVFENPNKKNMDGTSKTDSRQAFAGATNLGAIALDLDTGKAVVDVSKITTVKETATAQASAFDFTGSYVATSAGITLPTGYVAPCAVGADRETCRGPSEGMTIWAKRLDGKSTTDGSPVYGVMLWESEAKFTNCGSKLGFSYADAKAFGGVDLSASGVAEGAFTWASDFVDGWKYTGATARNGLMKMEKVDNFLGYPGMKQYFKQYKTWNCSSGPCSEGSLQTAAGFMFNASTPDSGCKAGGRPYQLTDHSGMSCTGQDLGQGLNKSVCTKVVSGATVTCTNIGGAFTPEGVAIPNAMVRYPDDFDVIVRGPFCDTNSNGTLDSGEYPPMWSNGGSQTCSTGTLVAGQACGDIVTGGDDQKELLKLRCYADGLWTLTELPAHSSKCTREIQTNWSANTSVGFIESNGPAKAKGEYVFEKFDFDSPNSGSFANEEIRYEGVQDGNNWTDCKVFERFSMSFRKIVGTNDILAEMISETRNASVKPVCIAKYGTPETMKTIFKMVKQP